jgi:hypothetical protein
MLAEVTELKVSVNMTNSFSRCQNAHDDFQKCRFTSSIVTNLKFVFSYSSMSTGNLYIFEDRIIGILYSLNIFSISLIYVNKGFNKLNYK